LVVIVQYRLITLRRKKHIVIKSIGAWWQWEDVKAVTELMDLFYALKVKLLWEAKTCWPHQIRWLGKFLSWLLLSNSNNIYNNNKNKNKIIILIIFKILILIMMMIYVMIIIIILIIIIIVIIITMILIIFIIIIIILIVIIIVIMY